MSQNGHRETVGIIERRTLVISVGHNNGNEVVSLSHPGKVRFG